MEITERDYQEYVKAVRAQGRTPVSRVEFVDACEEMERIKQEIDGLEPHGEWEVDTKRGAPKELFDQMYQLEVFLGY